ncbi:MAG: DNA mismatch repair protein MutS [Planctomycetaceae bacterium]|jgi:DNA mismatch repair protein MutS|nr:DNA mismatch repair protein MutS [Planctomycetaceae bacterium]MBT6487108.1 DNA mismatch repair protein MutS [Planctomycetaceae bacterium]MBT6496940.1 DNA mismatch repair protein MutS [Planctomycetaceae bacterium]
MTEPKRKLTPMMERYMEVKQQNPGTILLFRMGDFYELFNEDARLAAKVLGLTLTSRDKASTNPIPMAGFPYHSLQTYLGKLIQAGYRAAICEQVEDPKQAKGLVKREVTQIVTPGTLTDEELLDPRESNFLACIYPTKEYVGLAWLEVSTGRFVSAELKPHHLRDELSRIAPAECIVPDGCDQRLLPEGALLTERPAWTFARNECQRLLCEHFGTKTLDGFDLDADSAGVTAAGALLTYVQETQKSSLGHITRLEPFRRGTNLVIDEATRRSLELTITLRDSRRDGSLLSVIDETVTAMGARLLAEWLSNPLCDISAINHRLDAVEELVGNPMLCRDIREQLDETYDLQRLTARIATGRASPRDLGCLAHSLSLLPKLKAQLAGREAALLIEVENKVDLCPEVRSDVESTLVDEPPVLTTDGGMIRSGCHTELDKQRELARGGKEWIAHYLGEEIKRTGIQNLKVGFNKVFGYYLEVTRAQADKVPEDYIRKQTLKNQERYITPELKTHEDKVLRAEERAIALEQELFNALRERVSAECRRLKQTAEALAEIDVLTALAVLAVSQHYCRPEMTAEPLLDIREGRHPVLDRLQPTGEFVPNDVVLGVESREASVEGKAHRPDPVGSHTGRIQIITGPNMAGKSTYIRQAALITILAQMGSFVPATEARIGIADRVFARVGASDELGKGQSTFMVEMTEAARILHAASQSSLVILDEIGRGTSTYDGISLAWAITEHLHDVVVCRTLFATHYHELTELTQTLSGTSNWNVAIREQDDDVIFLHRIVEGAADKSYGIHVARLAGVPTAVIDRARVILDTLEADHLDDTGRPNVPPRQSHSSGEQQLSLFEPPPHPLLDEIRDMDLDQMTPLAALEELHRMRQTLKD